MHAFEIDRKWYKVTLLPIMFKGNRLVKANIQATNIRTIPYEDSLSYV